ncbi:MAG: LysM peptidoglycan-binding domain-containing protein [Candidatus Levybacteria bacterium]|nr:LysM peptidoglycan-binding domain-containing protein [Candidatus Levybacteria bacterium]
MAKQNRKARSGIFSYFKLTESYTSLILGAIVVLVAGILFISFVRNAKNTQTSSTKEESNLEKQESNESKTSSTYTVKPGDDLWTISENVYKDGYKWTELARANKLQNPDIIHSGNKLTIPTITQKSEPTPTVPTQVTEKSSITGSSYTVKSGDNLWDISVRAYGDGYKWVELAKVNNLSNPDLIFSGNVLKLPR